MVIIDAVNMELIGHVTATDMALFGLHNRLVGYTSFHLPLKTDTLSGLRKFYLYQYETNLSILPLSHPTLL